jgi:hypothetical protein
MVCKSLVSIWLQALSHYYGGFVASDPREKANGWLTAFDASSGKERWKYASTTPLVAGVTATSGGVGNRGRPHWLLCQCEANVYHNPLILLLGAGAP